MSFRHKARELALQVLFQWDIHHGTSGWLKEFWDQNPVSAEPRHFAETLFEGVISHVTELDKLIGQYAENWTVSRMAVIDRNVMAVFRDEAVVIGKANNPALAQDFTDRILSFQPARQIHGEE